MRALKNPAIIVTPQHFVNGNISDIVRSSFIENKLFSARSDQIFAKILDQKKWGSSLLAVLANLSDNRTATQIAKFIDETLAKGKYRQKTLVQHDESGPYARVAARLNRQIAEGMGRQGQKPDAEAIFLSRPLDKQWIALSAQNAQQKRSKSLTGALYNELSYPLPLSRFEAKKLSTVDIGQVLNMSKKQKFSIWDTADYFGIKLKDAEISASTIKWLERVFIFYLILKRSKHTPVWKQILQSIRTENPDAYNALLNMGSSIRQSQTPLSWEKLPLYADQPYTDYIDSLRAQHQANIMSSALNQEQKKSLNELGGPAAPDSPRMNVKERMPATASKKRQRDEEPDEDEELKDGDGQKQKPVEAPKKKEKEPVEELSAAQKERLQERQRQRLQEEALEEVYEDERKKLQLIKNSKYGRKLVKLDNSLYSNYDTQYTKVPAFTTPFLPTFKKTQQLFDRAKNANSVAAARKIVLQLKQPESKFFQNIQKVGGASVGGSFNAATQRWEGPLVEKALARLNSIGSHGKRLQKNQKIFNMDADEDAVRKSVPDFIKQIINSNDALSLTGLGPIHTGDKNRSQVYAGRWLDKATGRVRVLPPVSTKYIDPISFSQRLAYYQGKVINHWNQTLSALSTLKKFQTTDRDKWVEKQKERILGNLSIFRDIIKRHIVICNTIINFFAFKLEKGGKRAPTPFIILSAVDPGTLQSIVSTCPLKQTQQFRDRDDNLDVPQDLTAKLKLQATQWSTAVDAATVSIINQLKAAKVTAEFGESQRARFIAQVEITGAKMTSSMQRSIGSGLKALARIRMFQGKTGRELIEGAQAVEQRDEIIRKQVARITNVTEDQAAKLAPPINMKTIGEVKAKTMDDYFSKLKGLKLNPTGVVPISRYQKIKAAPGGAFQALLGQRFKNLM